MSSKGKTFLASPTVRFLCIRFSWLLIVVGFGLFIYYGIIVVLPAGRAIHFKETKCFVNYSTFDGDVVCECEAGYIVRSCYPCLKIYVVFYTGDNENLTVNGSALSVRSILHEDLWSINSKCTFSPPSCCSRSTEENTRLVRDYMDKNGRNGSWAPCHYNRFNHTEVIQTLGNYRFSIFMALFWPLLAVLIGLCLMKYVKNQKPETVKKITKDDRRRLLVLSTMTAFLKTDGSPAAYLQTGSVRSSRKSREVLGRSQYK